MLEDESEIRSSCGPANDAALNNLMLALIKRSGKVGTVPEGMTHYTANREAALEALLTRQKGNAAHVAGQPSSPGAARWERGRFARETAPGGRGVECAWRDPAVAETVSGPPCGSTRRFGGVPGILQRAK